MGAEAPPPPPDAPPPPPPDTTPTPDVAAPPPEAAPLNEAPPPLTESPAPSAPTDPNALPEIEARSFKLSVVRRSKSGRVYLFDDLDAGNPRVGRILLLREGERPVMAFRMLKSYPDKKQIAAGKIRQYEGFPTLEAGRSFAAIEKVSDILPPPPSAQDNADIRELENSVGGAPPPPPGGDSPPPPSDAAGPPPPPEDGTPTPPPGTAPAYDPELDAASGPRPSTTSSMDDSFPEDDSAPIAVEELKILDPNRQWLTAGFGFLVNNFPDYFLAGGVSYGLTLKKMVFLKRPYLQDSLALETGLYLYKIIAEQLDTYTITPAIVTLRYNMQIGEGFSLFAYGGFMTNFLVGSSQGGASDTDFATNLNALSSFKSDEGAFPYQPTPAVGIGMLFSVGPNWDARFDVGFDHIGAGLVLRF